jgi:hypothetical protein
MRHLTRRAGGIFCSVGVAWMVSSAFAGSPNGERLATGLRSAAEPVAVDDAAALGNPGATDRVIVWLKDASSRTTREALAPLNLTPAHWLASDRVLLPATDVARVAHVARGATTYRVEWKLDPELGGRLTPFETPERIALEQAGKLRVIVTLFAGEDVGAFERRLAEAGISTRARAAMGGQTSVDVILDDDRGLGALIHDPAVQYIEEAPEITLRNSTTRGIVQSDSAAATPLYDHGLHGEDQVVGILDSQVDVNHCSFYDDTHPIGELHRKILAYNAPSGAFSHGTHVAGIAVGDNGDNSDTRGVAYAAQMVYNTQPSFDELSLLDRLTTHHGQGARVHTNSWGDDGTTAYNNICRGLDTFMHTHEDDLVIIAATNLANLRNPENAKNVLSVAASHDTPNLNGFCSGGSGPTNDGRRKPELTAPGCFSMSAAAGTACGVVSQSGSSMAAPAIAGVALLARQYYMEGFYPSGEANPADGFVPTGALLKATLINTGHDLAGVPLYPSAREGWGRVVAGDALYFKGETRRLDVRDVRNASGLSTGDEYVFDIRVQSSAEPLRLTLAWTEPAGAPGVVTPAVNDLNLELYSPAGVRYFGNVFAGGVSVSGGFADDRNNVEQILIPSPPAGVWTVRVAARHVPQGPQGFALVTNGDFVVEPTPVTITLPDGFVEALTPGEEMTFSVRIRDNADALAENGATLWYRYGAGAFSSAPLTHVEDDLYAATLPATALCSATPQYYISAMGLCGDERTFPSNAPTTWLTAAVGAFEDALIDDFELDLGWAVESEPTVTSGAWERAVPNGSGDRGEVVADFDGSGMCYLTGNGVGDFDLDGGATYLISPAFDLTGAAGVIEYAVWYTNHTGGAPNADTFVVSLSNDDGETWTPVHTIGPDTTTGWVRGRVKTAGVLPSTPAMRLRFEASDRGAGSVVEAAVDAVRVRKFGCTSTIALGDMNCDGTVSVSDIGAFVLALTDPAAYATAYPLCDATLADMNGDGSVTVSDIGGFVALLTE